jgi:hypothetical protein
MALSSILQSSVLLQFQGPTKIHIPWAMAESRKNMPVTVSMRGAHSDSTTSNMYPLRPVLCHVGFTRYSWTSMAFPAPAVQASVAHMVCRAKQMKCKMHSHRSLRRSIWQQMHHLAMNLVPHHGPSHREQQQQQQL